MGMVTEMAHRRCEVHKLGRIAFVAGLIGVACAMRLTAQEGGFPKAVSAASQATAPPATTAAKEQQNYVLGPQDQIVIHGANIADLAEKPVRLDLRGDINMPIVGRLHAAGLTTEQLETALLERLKVYLLEPDVTVDITEFRSQPVSILGEVGTPGIQQVQGRKTLLEIIALVGGLKPEAGPSVKVTRSLDHGFIPLPGAVIDASGRFSVVDIPLRPLMDAQSPEKNIEILPNDAITVPKAEIVYVMGEVGHPGPISLTGGHSISLIEALSAAGGIAKTAAAEKSRILRQNDQGQRRTELAVDLKKVMAVQTDDLSLNPGDIVFVPNSRSQRITMRAIEAAISMGTMMGTYGVIH